MLLDVNRTAGLARCSSPLANSSYVGSVQRNYAARAVSRHRALADDAGRVGCEFEAGMRTRGLRVGAVLAFGVRNGHRCVPVSQNSSSLCARRSKSKPNSCDPLKMPASNEARLHGADAFSLKKSRQTARSDIAHAGSRAHRVNSHAKRKRMLLSLFVVVDAMQTRLRNMARVPEFIGN